MPRKTFDEPQPRAAEACTEIGSEPVKPEFDWLRPLCWIALGVCICALAAYIR